MAAGMLRAEECRLRKDSRIEERWAPTVREVGAQRAEGVGSRRLRPAVLFSPLQRKQGAAVFRLCRLVDEFLI